MDMNQFISTLSALDEGSNILFNTANIFIKDPDTSTYIHFVNMKKSDCQALGEILKTVKDIKLKNFVGGINKTGDLDIEIEGTIKLGGNYVEIANMLRLFLKLHNPVRSDLTVAVIDIARTIRDVSYKQLSDEMKEILGTYSDDEIDDMHLGFLGITIPAADNGENIKIIMKEAFV